MKRSEIVDAFGKIQKNLELSKLPDAFSNMRRGGTESVGLNQTLLTALHTYALLAKDYNETDKRVQKLLGLSDLVSAEGWGELVYLKEPHSYTHRFVELNLALNNV